MDVAGSLDSSPHEQGGKTGVNTIKDVEIGFMKTEEAVGKSMKLQKLSKTPPSHIWALRGPLRQQLRKPLITIWLDLRMSDDYLQLVLAANRRGGGCVTHYNYEA
eukprot:6197809-Pleurochrysis_carterae.AAC.1